MFLYPYAADYFIIIKKWRAHHNQIIPSSYAIQITKDSAIYYDE